MNIYSISCLLFHLIPEGCGDAQSEGMLVIFTWYYKYISTVIITNVHVMRSIAFWVINQFLWYTDDWFWFGANASETLNKYLNMHRIDYYINLYRIKQPSKNLIYLHYCVQSRQSVKITAWYVHICWSPLVCGEKANTVPTLLSHVNTACHKCVKRCLIADART